MATVARLIEPHLGSLKRYALTLARNRPDAEDLVQDSVARALQKSGRFEPGTNLRAWLFTIMHNLHANTRRYRAARPEWVAGDDLPDASAPATQEAAIVWRDLNRAMAVLPPDQRDVLMLIGVEGLSYAETAEALDIPIGTVMSRLSRGREAIRRFMTEGRPPLRRVK